VLVLICSWLQGSSCCSSCSSSCSRHHIDTLLP
jgi:hypothetical protein